MTDLKAGILLDKCDIGFGESLSLTSQAWDNDLSASNAVALGISSDDLFRDQCDIASCDPDRQQSLYRQIRRQEVNTSYGLRRLRERLLGHTSDGASSEDVLTLLLCNALEEVEARELALRLLDRFGGLRAIFAAREIHLLRTCDGQQECVSLIKGYYLLMKTALREPVESRPILTNYEALYQYLQTSLAHEESEVFRMLFLNTKNMLIKDELISTGTINHVCVYPREVVKRVLEVGAHAVILVHNHPSGDQRPSAEDITMTMRLKRVLTDIDVVLHDHVIVGRHHCESMQRSGLI